MKNRQVARQLRITDQTVCKWRERFRVSGLEGLADKPRPGTPRKIADAPVEALITRTLESTPPQGTHWSTRTMAEATQMSQSAISRIWRAFSLQPHHGETFKLSTHPFFVEKVRDIVGLYLNPPERALGLCVDEKSQVQALDRTRPYCCYGRLKPESGLRLKSLPARSQAQCTASLKCANPSTAAAKRDPVPHPSTP